MHGFYRAMHFSAKRGIAIVCCPSVCDFQVPWSHRLESRPNSLRPSPGLTPKWAIWSNGNTQKLGQNRGGKFNCGRIILLASKMTSLREGGARPGKSSLIGVAIFSAWSREIPASHGMRHKRCADCGRDYARTQIRSFSCGSIGTSPLKCRWN